MASLAQKSKNYFQKEKKNRSENHKKFQKKGKKRQKSDKLSLFKIPSVAFVAPLKKRQKGDKRRQFVAFHFVAAHPRFRPIFGALVYG